MFCAYCGAKLEDGSVFCSNCGKKVIDNIGQVQGDEESSQTMEEQVTYQQYESVNIVEPFVEEKTPLEVVLIEEQTLTNLSFDEESDSIRIAQSEVAPSEEGLPEEILPEEGLPEEVELSAEDEQSIDLEHPIDFKVEIPMDMLEEMPDIQSVKPTIDINVAEPTKSTVDFYVDEPINPIEFEPEKLNVFSHEHTTMEPEIDMRACNICGALLEHDSVFCSNCGSRVTAEGQDTKAVSPDGYTHPMEDQTLSAGISEEEQSILTNMDMKKQKAKSKKRLIITAAILAVLVLGLGGFFIFTKITLGNLEDSAIAFENLVTEKGLADYEEYSTLIKDAKEKASGWNVFGASELEDKLSAASNDCESLSVELTDLMAKRSNYENLSQDLIMDSNQENTITGYLEEFDTAIALADVAKANEILVNLESTKTTLITDNQAYIDSLMEDLFHYENPDFTQADWDEYNSQIAIAENYIKKNQFIQAEEQIYNCTTSRTTIEQRIVEEKEAAAVALLYAKPETLNVMISDVIYDDTSYRNEFEQALEAQIGIDVIFEQFEAASYYDAVNTVFAANTMPDVVYLSQDMYKEFQTKGYLTDLTQYWQESELLAASNYYGEEAMERLKIDGQIYGFTPVRGYTCVTYIRQSWLDELGISVPTTYDEFYQMLVAFTENKMGTDDSASYGMTAPGFLYNSEPYTSFLQPFYQKAVPEIIQSSSGEWVDGFVQQDMVDALYRLQEAYKLGLLDQGMSQRTVSEAISEFGSGKCGVISLWEGDGADYLINELKKNGLEDDIIVMEPLVEMGSYIGKEPAVFAITTNCENPGGVMKYFFEPMLDGGEVQKLWTYGVEGYHWANADASNDTSLGNLDNQLVTLPYEGMDETTYNYNLIDPLRALATLNETDPGISQISDLAAISASVANQYYEASPNVKYNETYWHYFGEIQAAREEAVNKVMLEDIDPVTALEEYKYNVQYIMDQVLSEMNQL